jgi:hypothetical protein
LNIYELRKKLAVSYKIILTLATLVICLTIVVVWFFYSIHKKRLGIMQIVSIEEKVLQKKFPNIDFTILYPYLTSREIDQLQREHFSIRFVYAPFVQFKPIPLKKRFVEITQHGYRKGASDQPWPPKTEDIVVFVFGGSTTFSYFLPNEKTLVASLQEELQKVYKKQKVRCYNFGVGFYYSTQERILFESLLQSGIVPDIAIFIDGFNDFRHPDDLPYYTKLLYDLTAPELPGPPRISISTEKNREKAIEYMLSRYKNNIRITKGIAQAYGISVIFVGQPIPLSNYPINSNTYIFDKTARNVNDVFKNEINKSFYYIGLDILDDLLISGYIMFERFAKKGEFGTNFIWAGDVFSNAKSYMYVDNVHYSHEAGKILAKFIATQSFHKGLLNIGN